MLYWIYSFTNQRSCATRYGETTYSYKQQCTGLTQGSVISPTLFNIMINYLPKKLTHAKWVKCGLYADDLVIWMAETRKHLDRLSEKINEALYSLEQWCKTNRMTINTAKTSYTTFTLTHTLPQIN